MCLIFFIFFLGMFGTAGYGYVKGDPMKLLTPFDASGKLWDLKFKEINAE